MISHFLLFFSYCCFAFRFFSLALSLPLPSLLPSFLGVRLPLLSAGEGGREEGKEGGKKERTHTSPEQGARAGARHLKTFSSPLVLPIPWAGASHPSRPSAGLARARRALLGPCGSSAKEGGREGGKVGGSTSFLYLFQCLVSSLLAPSLPGVIPLPSSLPSSVLSSVPSSVPPSLT